MPELDLHDKLMAVLKRRGYLAPAYEIYGGVAGFYDYGPLGAALKQNLQNLWREIYVLHEGMAEIECPTISPEPVFRASGHLEKFADTVIECPACGTGSRGDHLVKGEWKRLAEEAGAILHKNGGDALASTLTALVEAIRASADRDPNPPNLRALLEGRHAAVEALAKANLAAGDVHVRATATTLEVAKKDRSLYKGTVNCPGCTKPLDVSNAKIDAFNLMFKTPVGPGTGRAGYLRPETAQGMFMNFPWLYRYFREALPFGAVQIGKAYRNEISPRQGLLRLREFSQMEAEVFFDPENKTWSRFKELEGRELNLLASGEDNVVRMRMGDAVAKGIIANGALGYFIALTDVFLTRAGIAEDRIRFRQHEPTEKAHYSTDTWDAEFLSPRFGWVEIVGIADRTNYDLSRHSEVSGQPLTALRKFAEPKMVEVNRVVPIAAKLGPLFKNRAGAVSKALEALHPDHATAGAPLTVTVDGERVTVPPEAFKIERGTEKQEGERYVPHVVEPSYGVDRIFYAVLEGAYVEKEWATLVLPAKVAPIKVGVFPLMAKDGLDELAVEIERDLVAHGLVCQYDDGGSIGKRYARQDEVGTPYCVTIDYDSKKDGTVTVRERDTAGQVRIPRSELGTILAKLVSGRLSWADFSSISATP